MRQRFGGVPVRTGRRNRPKLVGMGHDLAGACPLRQTDQQLAGAPDREHAMLRAYLHGAARGRWVGWQAIQHAVIRQIAIPTDLAFFGRKPLPGKPTWQRLQAFVRPAVNRTLVGRMMDLAVALLTPGP